MKAIRNISKKMTDTNGAAKFSVAKLNNNNYQIWKFKVRMLLIREGKWIVITEPKSEPLTAIWIQRDEKAQSTISLSVEDDQIIHICKCTSAQEMWNELQKVHGRANLSNKLYLLGRLYQSKLSKNQDMQEYIRNTLEMVARLRGIGEEIKEFHVAALLLGGLPESYEILVTALHARPDNELTLEYVKGKLVDEYKRKMENSDNSPNTSDQSALKINDKSKFNENRKTGEEPTCFVCKSTGHFKKNCKV